MGGAAIADCDGTQDPGERDEDARFCGFGEVALGVLLGVGTAILVDADLLSRETVRVPRERRQTSGPRLAPALRLPPKSARSC
jgi:hypothetical protein